MHRLQCGPPFAELDANGDGTVSEEELAAMQKSTSRDDEQRVNQRCKHTGFMATNPAHRSAAGGAKMSVSDGDMVDDEDFAQRCEHDALELTP